MIKIREWIKKNSQNFIGIAGLCLIMTVFVVGVYWIGKSSTPKDNSKLIQIINEQIDTKYAGEMQRLNDKVKFLEKDIKLSNQKYNQLKSSISIKDKEIQDIKAPVSNAELRKRLADLGYQAR